MLVELGILSLVALAGWQASKPGPGIMTPERRLVFRHALNKIDPPLPPEKLNELAAIFDSQGLPHYADILRKRAEMRARPPELKAAYRTAFRKAMGSNDPLVVRAAATAFEAQGMVANAAALRNYAVKLDAAAQIPGPDPSTTAAPSVPDAVIDTDVPTDVHGDPIVSALPETDTSHDDELEAEFAGPSNLIAIASQKPAPPPPPSVPPPPPSDPALPAT